jgi:hypothetical protein
MERKTDIVSITHREHEEHGDLWAFLFKYLRSSAVYFNTEFINRGWTRINADGVLMGLNLRDIHRIKAIDFAHREHREHGDFWAFLLIYLRSSAFICGLF